MFVCNDKKLRELHEAFSQGDEWAQKASMIIAVYSMKEYDCNIRDRAYYLFDTGMAIVFILLRATELGLAAHPIAGYSPKKVKRILGIPEDRKVITLVIGGNRSKEISSVLSEKQREAEQVRPLRKEINEFIHIDEYKK